MTEIDEWLKAAGEVSQNNEKSERKNSDKKAVTKSRIREHNVKGSYFYSWRQGSSKEIYLGSADYLLRLVNQDRKGKSNE